MFHNQGLFKKGKETPNSMVLIFIAAMQMFPIQALFNRERQPEFHFLNIYYRYGMFPIQGLFKNNGNVPHSRNYLKKGKKAQIPFS